MKIPQGDSSDEEVPELVPDNQEEYQTPPEGTTSPLPLIRQQAEIERQLDEALEKALAKNPLPSTSSKKQGGGDRETTPSGSATVPRAPLNMAEEKWYLEPNKVQFMDGPDTYRANVGRHRVPPLKLMRARTFPHLVFRWFKFTLKTPNRITHDKLRLAIWDTSFWNFWVKFGHNGP